MVRRLLGLLAVLAAGEVLGASSALAGPNWLLVYVCTMPNPEFFVL